jgi:hypothetical protein
MEPIGECSLQDNNKLLSILKTNMTKDKVLISLRKSVEIHEKANAYLDKLLNDCKNKKIDVNESRLYK